MNLGKEGIMLFGDEKITFDESLDVVGESIF